MEYENTNTTEVTETDLSAFDGEWDESPAPAEEESEDLAMEAEETPEAGGVSQTEGEGEDNAEPADVPETEPAAEDKAVSQRFTLKHLGAEKEYEAEEVKNLAEKGLDYDRQKADYETFQDAVNELGGISEIADRNAFLEELAAGREGGVKELIASTRAALLSKREGISAEDARKRVDEEAKGNTVSVKELAKKAGERREKAEADNFNKGLRDFVRDHPGLDARDIPKEVWDEVRGGRALSEAYGRYELRAAKAELERVKAELAAEKQNNANRQKSAGSMKTAGAKSTAIDPFDIPWDD